MKQYRVRAKPNDPHLGFHRSGRHFLTGEWTVLSEDEMTPEIENEDMLIVEEIADGLPADTNVISAEVALLQKQLDEKNAEVDRLNSEIDAMRLKTPATVPAEPTAAELLPGAEGDRLPCPYCEKDYATGDTLQKHLMDKHSEEPTLDAEMKALGLE